MQLRQEIRYEHHLTFTNEAGPNKGTYLTHRVIPIRGATGQCLAQEVESVLQEYSISYCSKVILLDNTSINTGLEAGLVKKSYRETYISSVVPYIKMSCQ